MAHEFYLSYGSHLGVKETPILDEETIPLKSNGSPNSYIEPCLLSLQNKPLQHYKSPLFAIPKLSGVFQENLNHFFKEVVKQ